MSVRLTQWKIGAAIGIAIVSGIMRATPANATVRIGSAMLIERDVSGLISGQQQKVLKGDDVFENEFIKTEIASQARLLFIDKTQLVLGPTASARLDRLVFNPDQSVNTLAVNARAGAIRWISGDSPSSAYLIETPVVTIRPHGTIFDLLVEPQRTTVVLQEGIIEVCLIDEPQRCRVLSRKGEFTSATRADIEAPREGGPGSPDFEDRCLSAASKECNIGKSASIPAEPLRKSGTGEKEAEILHKSKTAKEAYVEPRESKKYEPPRRSKVTDVESKKYEPRRRVITVHQSETSDGPNILSVLGGIGVFRGLFGAHGSSYGNNRPGYHPPMMGSGGHPPMMGSGGHQ
jgi:hypothetical protein